MVEKYEKFDKPIFVKSYVYNKKKGQKVSRLHEEPLKVIGQIKLLGRIFYVHKEHEGKGITISDKESMANCVTNQAFSDVDTALSALRANFKKYNVDRESFKKIRADYYARRDQILLEEREMYDNLSQLPAPKVISQSQNDILWLLS